MIYSILIFYFKKILPTGSWNVGNGNGYRFPFNIWRRILYENDWVWYDCSCYQKTLWKSYAQTKVIYYRVLSTSLILCQGLFMDLINSFVLCPGFSNNFSLFQLETKTTFSKQCWPSCSTCPLDFGCWDLSHVIFLMLRKKELLAKMSKDHFEWK